MIQFVIKGLLRDKSRSLFPVLVVMSGVFVTVLFFSWMQGVKNDMVWSSAKFQTGHVKIMTRAYAEEADQMPNDLALEGITSLLDTLNNSYRDMYWVPRINFGGLLDIPDENGETRSQSPVVGMGIELVNSSSHENEILNLHKAMAQGRLPQQPGEIVISEELAHNLGVTVGDVATLISTTMYGSMSQYNFTVCGTIRFGIIMMDRSAVIADLADVQNALDMQDAASEILGFSKDYVYNPQRAAVMKNNFNKTSDPKNEFAPTMKLLEEQNGLDEVIRVFDTSSQTLVTIFIVIMSIVLWNAGLMASLRRYGEIGVRLAIGEEKGHLYRSLLYESLAIGLFGVILGTLLGLAISYYLQVKGINVGAMMTNSNMFMSNIMRAQVTGGSYIIGFIPGLCAPVLGTLISGIGVYKRQTSQLFRELEV